MTAVFEVDVVLVGPEIGKLGVRRVPAGDRGCDSPPVPFGHLPVLDADRPAQHRMLVKRDVTADIDAVRGAQSFVDSNSPAFDGQAQRPRQVQVGLDADRDEHQVGILTFPVGKRDAVAFCSGRGEQTLFYLEAFDEVPALLLRGLEIMLLPVSEDEVERQEPSLDVREFVFPAIAEMFFADGGIDLSRAELKHEASTGVSPRAGVAQTE